MKYKEINAIRALNAIQAVSRGRDYRYRDHHRDCRYTEITAGGGTAPSCIVGRAVALLIPGYLMIDVAGCFNVAVDAVRSATDVEFTTGAILVFQAAQGAQDAGATDEQARVVAERLLFALRYEGIE